MKHLIPLTLKNLSTTHQAVFHILDNNDEERARITATDTDFAEFLVTAANAHYGFVEILAEMEYGLYMLSTGKTTDWASQTAEIKQLWREKITKEGLAQAKAEELYDKA